MTDDPREMTTLITTLERKKASFDLNSVREEQQRQNTLVPVHSEDVDKVILMPPFPLDPEPNTQGSKSKKFKANKNGISAKSSEYKCYFNTQKPSVPNIFNNLQSKKERFSE